jgi:hypothetical protein
VSDMPKLIGGKIQVTAVDVQGDEQGPYGYIIHYLEDGVAKFTEISADKMESVFTNSLRFLSMSSPNMTHEDLDTLIGVLRRQWVAIKEFGRLAKCPLDPTVEGKMDLMMLSIERNIKMRTMADRKSALRAAGDIAKKLRNG